MPVNNAHVLHSMPLQNLFTLDNLAKIFLHHGQTSGKSTTMAWI
jgi:hypothetical protein